MGLKELAARLAAKLASAGEGAAKARMGSVDSIRSALEQDGCDEAEIARLLQTDAAAETADKRGTAVSTKA